ncbi:hypothetical protein GQ53DRAFT_810735 [Thozetella sp. PMI_491]|nr:hypothetical protein GQ53DRAFT_810735 [Thozetella sp. PMI_491]
MPMNISCDALFCDALFRRWPMRQRAPRALSYQNPANRDLPAPWSSVGFLGPSHDNPRFAQEAFPTHGDCIPERVEMDYARGAYNTATSKSAQRTLLNTFLLVIASVILYGFAALAYLLFYHNYLPDQVTTIPVHLQYGYGLHPYGVAHLVDKNLKDQQAYDITVSLTLPRSPTNLNRGNFMVALHLLTSDTGSAVLSSKSKPKPVVGSPAKLVPPYPEYPAHPGANTGPSQPNPHDAQFAGAGVLYTSTRPALIPYTDPLVSLASRILFIAYYVLFPHAERTQLIVSMVEKVTFARGGPLPSQLFLELQAGQDLQVYDAAVTLTAQLSGLRYIMHHYWLVSFLVLSTAFWACEVGFMAVAWLGLSLVFGGAGPAQEETTAMVKPGQTKPDVDGMSDTERTFPSTSRQMPLKYEGRVKTEEDDGPGISELLPPAGQGGEADDEDEKDDDEDEGFRDSGIGTSYSEGNRDGVRRRTSGSRGRQ